MVRSCRGAGLLAVALVLSLASTAAARPPPAKASWDLGRLVEPRLLGEGIISTEDDEVGGTFSPDGGEFYFVKLIQSTTFPRYGILCVSRFRDGAWTEPEVLPFSGSGLDLTPRLSPDGKTLYFASSRTPPGKPAHLLRIWSVERKADGSWGEPRPLPAPVNDDDGWNFGPSVTRSGTLYFVSTRGGQAPHLFRAARTADGYAPPERLGPEVNSEFNETDPYVSPDETLLVFASSGNGLGDPDRPETVKGGGVLYARADLYFSVKRNGRWTPARHLEHGVNSVAEESAPSLTPDGKYLVFTSERSPFTVPTAHRMTAEEVERLSHRTLNGHGNIFLMAVEPLGLSSRGGGK